MRFNTYQAKVKPTTITEQRKLSTDPNAYGGGRGLQNLGNIISNIGANKHNKLKQQIEILAAKKTAQNHQQTRRI